MYGVTNRVTCLSGLKIVPNIFLVGQFPQASILEKSPRGGICLREGRSCLLSAIFCLRGPPHAARRLVHKAAREAGVRAQSRSEGTPGRGKQ